MKREDLTKLGIEDKDVIDEIMKLHGSDIESHKSKLATAGDELKTIQEQLTEANKQIEAFKAMKVEDIQKAADDYKAKFEQAQKDAADQVSKLKFDHALDAALTGAKAKNSTAVKALLKSDDLKLSEDGSIVGLGEQLEKIKSENDYLFESDEKPPTIVTGGTNKPILGDAIVEAARIAAGLSPAGEK